MSDDATPTPADNGTSNTPAPPAQHQPAPQHGTDTDPGAEITKWKTLSRTHEQRWQKVTGELESVRQQVAERDIALNDARAESAKAVALAELRAELALAGMPREAAANYTKFLDPGRLLKDGQVNPEAIAQLVTDLPASLRTGPPDPDQGRSSTNQPRDMNQILRRAAGLT